jgi:spore coat protein H
MVPARLEFEGRTLDSVGVRFRGDQSLWDCVSNGKRKKGIKYPQYGFGNSDICAKFSMKFDFNKYKKDQHFFGLKALNFRSMSADPTKMHERLGFSLYKDMGIFAPRTGYAKLFVNDTLWGVFGVVEQIDGRFTKSRFPNSGDGNLYEDLWPESRTTDDEILNASKTYKDSIPSTSINDFKAFRDMVIATGTDSSNFLQKIGLLMDVPGFVRYMVVDRGITNFDGVVSAYGHMRHNYAWYHDQESGIFKIFPWDLDKTLLYPEPNFWTNNQSRGNNTVPNWNVVNSTYTSVKCTFDPGSGGGSYDVEPIDKDKFLRLFRNTTWNDFRKQGKIFLDSFFTEKRINDRLGKWRSALAPAIGQDPTIDSTEWSMMVDSLSRTIPLLRNNLQLMIDTLIRH